MFDWSFEFPKPGEVSIVDQDFAHAARRTFAPKMQALGYVLNEPSVTNWEHVKIVRIDVYDPSTNKVVGRAIRLDDGHEISDAVQINSDD
jgi:hypothetical protein